jgi:glycosyltransferase involved in cell wall biosynthesis
MLGNPTGERWLPPRIAVVHDWLYTFAGAERVLGEILICFPSADVFSLFDFVPRAERTFLQGKEVRTSFLQHMPFTRRLYQKYLPLMPAAIESLDLRPYDIVLSTSSAVAKGVLTEPRQLHVCYLQSRNLRYLYDERFSYSPHPWLRPLQEFVLSPVRVWDSVASHRPDRTVANSEFVRRWHCHRHGVDADMIYPPVDVALFSRFLRQDKEDYYVVVGRFESYKRVDLVVEAFNRAGKRLVVVGGGSKEMKLRRHARRNVEFVGVRPPEEVAKIVAGARAFVYAAREDFGIAPVEAQAAGTPVIAFGDGGALETVCGKDEQVPTGLFFFEQTPESIVAALEEFEACSLEFSAVACRTNAERFNAGRFRAELTAYVELAFQGHTRTIPRRGEPLPLTGSSGAS